jgi:hypothetical protein
VTDPSETSVLREILDRQQITDQLFRYCRAVDRRDGDLMQSVFHPDATNDGGEPKPVAELIKTVVTGPPTTRMHVVTNVLIDLDGDTAFVESYWIAYSTHDEDDARYTRTRAGRWLDRFERRGSDWKISYRRVVDEFARLDRVANVPKVGQHRGVSGPDDPVYHMRQSPPEPTLDSQS